MEMKPQENDHKKLGRELELFYIDETIGKGLPVWLPKGAAVRRELERFIVDEEIKRGYQHVYTPDIARLELYEKSGHYPHYKDSMYAPVEIDGEKFMLRPMTCPHHFQLYLSRPHSYRELPMRIAEISRLYRYEQSGELMGLQRVRTFSLSDAHIFCKSIEEAIEEIGKALDLIEYANGLFGLVPGEDYHYRLSLGDHGDTGKYRKNDAEWKKAEDLLREAMQKRGVKFVEAKGEAAFYGPKIDVQMKNANGKEDTVFTVQYDLWMPDRFNLTYIGEDGKEHRAFVVHRSSIGSIERTVAFLIEKYKGAFPAWLAPVHAIILPIGEKQNAYAESIFEKFRDEGIRVEIDTGNESLGKKIRAAKLTKVPYLLVVGEKELEEKTVSVESRDRGQLGTRTLEEFLDMLREEIKEKK